MPDDEKEPAPETFGVNARVKIREGVLSREVDGETVIVHLERGIYFGLDEVGTRIWQWMEEHGRLDRVLEELVATYDVEEATAREDLLRLVSELREQTLLAVETGPGT